jgi:type IV secretory pathway VirJ component
MKFRHSALLAATVLTLQIGSAASKTIKVIPFGDVSIERPSEDIRCVTLLFSRQSGWDSVTAEVARRLTATNAPVIAIDTPVTDRRFANRKDDADQLIDEHWRIAGADSEFRPAEATNPGGLEGLPVTEVRDKGVTEGDTFAIFLSGDGGWAHVDSGVAQELAGEGIPVVGVSSLKYFWQARSPESLAADIDRIADQYLEAWHKKRLILIGYSFGADVVPFAANRLSPSLKPKLTGVVLLGPSYRADFEFHVADWLRTDSRGAPTSPEIKRLDPLPVLCVHGEKEAESVCPNVVGPHVTDLKTSGGHDLGGEFKRVADAVAKLAAM